MEEGRRCVLALPSRCTGLRTHMHPQPAAPATLLASPAATCSWSHLWRALGRGTEHCLWAYMFLVVSLVPCILIKMCWMFCRTEKEVRPIAFLSFACKPVSKARPLQGRGNHGQAESVLSPTPRLPFSSRVQRPHEGIRSVLRG